MIVSGGQQRDSAIYIAVFILPQTPLPSRLPQNISEFPVLHSKSLTITYFKYIPVLPKLPNYPFLFLNSRNRISQLHLVYRFQLSLIMLNCFPKWLHVLAFPSALYESSSYHMPSLRSVVVGNLFFSWWKSNMISFSWWWVILKSVSAIVFLPLWNM